MKRNPFLLLQGIDSKTIIYWLPSVTALLFFVFWRGTIVYTSGVILLTLLMLIPAFSKIANIKIFPYFWFLSFLVFSIISIVKYVTFNDTGDVDFACYTNILSNTLNGRFLYQSFLGENLLAVHSSATVLLFLPFYALLGNTGLLIAQTAAWCFGLYLIFRTNPQYPQMPLFFIIGVICTPYLLSGVFYGFHPDILIIPETGLILYAFTKRKYLSFITGMLLIFLTKEVFILIPVIFSIIALIEKREWKWSVIPFLSSVGYALLYWYLISPTLRIGNSHVFQNLLPQSAGGILQHMVSPGILIFIVNSLLLYLPLQTISLRYSIFPVAYILFYSIFPDNSFRDPWRHYVLIIGTVSLFPIIIADISRIKKLTIPVFLIMVYAYFQWVPIAEFQNRRSDEIHKVRSLISSIPTNKSVVAHGPFMAFVAGRTLIANWIYRPKTWSEYDYLLFDRSFLPEWWQERENLNKTIDSLTISDQWNVISSVKSTILLQNLKNFK